MTKKDTINYLGRLVQQLQERNEYLERSNNRREDTILDLRQEIIDNPIINDAKEYILNYLCSWDYTSGEFKELANVFTNLLNKLDGEDNE